MPKQTLKKAFKKKLRYTTEIVNVTEIINGVSSAPKSFIITKEKDRNKIVEKAEKLFIRLALKNGMSKEDSESTFVLDDGCFDNNNGYEVIINWSEIQ